MPYLIWTLADGYLDGSTAPSTSLNQMQDYRSYRAFIQLLMEDRRTGVALTAFQSLPLAAGPSCVLRPARERGRELQTPFGIERRLTGKPRRLLRP